METLILVGGRGMLGQAIRRRAEVDGRAVAVLDLPEFDITDPQAVRDGMPAQGWVINCAAYTRVDDAEAEPDLAFRINAEGAGNLARVCAERGQRLIQISTDYVFDGTRAKPYVEEDPPSPLSVYGRSKWEGERAVRGAGGKHLIVRSQSLFGSGGRHFVGAIHQRLAAGDGPLRVVDDQVSAPTYTPHLADQILRLADARAEGVVHVSASGSCSWWRFARAIADLVRPAAKVLPVSTAEFGRPAPRPAHAVLSNARAEAITGHRMPTWREGLASYMRDDP